MQIAGMLKQLAIPFVLVELDQRRIERAKAASFPIVYGDGSQEVVQDALRIQRASLLVVTTPSIVVARSIISNARKINSGIRVIAQMSNPDYFSVFKELQVTDLVNSELEAGLEMIRQVLLFLRIPAPEIQHRTENLRNQLLTQSTTSAVEYRTLGQMRAAEQQFDLQWVEIENDNPLINQSIAEAEIRKITGVSVVGIIRNNTLETNPDPSFRFREHDLVAIIGSAQDLHKFHCFINPLLE